MDFRIASKEKFRFYHVGYRLGTGLSAIITIWNPNGSKHADAVAMIELENGIYYYDITLVTPGSYAYQTSDGSKVDSGNFIVINKKSPYSQLLKGGGSIGKPSISRRDIENITLKFEEIQRQINELNNKLTLIPTEIPEEINYIKINDMQKETLESINDKIKVVNKYFNSIKDEQKSMKDILNPLVTLKEETRLLLSEVNNNIKQNKDEFIELLQEKDDKIEEKIDKLSNKPTITQEDITKLKKEINEIQEKTLRLVIKGLPTEALRSALSEGEEAWQ